MVSGVDEKKNENSKISRGGGHTFLQSFKTINFGDKNKSNYTDNSGMTKFFKKIKNNLDRTLSNKNDISNDYSNNEIKEISSSEEDENNDNILNINIKNNNNNDVIDGKGNAFAQTFIKQQTLFANKFFKFSSKRQKDNKYESTIFEDKQSKRKSIFVMNTFNYKIDDDIEEVDEENQNEAVNTIRRNSQDFSKDMPSYSTIKAQLLQNIKKNNTIKNKTLKNIQNDSKQLINEVGSLYDKSDYEKTVRYGTIVESDNMLDGSINKNNNKKSKSIKKEEENNSKNQKNQKYKSHINNDINLKILNKKNNKNSKPKNSNKKYILIIRNLEEKVNQLNQMLFCSRVAIENALDVCQTISSCYKWVGENYLDSQIKKVIKEAKLKEKQKEDKEKYGNIGNVPKKETPAKKKIIRASDQSFKLLLNMIMGIQIAVQSIPNFHIKNNEDLSKYMTNMLYSIQTINFGKKKEEVFILKEFAGIIFNNIRLYLGFDKDDFIASISPQDFITELMISNQTIFEELCSTGRSGSLFYYTRDGKFIVKTIKKDEYKFIKQILPDYFKHLKTYPLSLLPKFLGCYVLTRKIKKKRDKIYFIVMLNVFATSKHIHIRYDLKGSRVGRRVLTGKRDAEIMAKGDLALKDLDLEKRKEKMYIGEKNDILLKQIKNDADFLCKIEANDYSLLLGIHYINKEKKNRKLSSIGINQNKTNIEDSILKESTLSEKSCDSRQEKLKALIDFEDGGIISETGNEVYFVGIIDILTKFNFKKKCEHFIKMIRYCSNNMSCTPPQMYRDRFVNYMNKVIVKSSSFNSVKNPLMERFKNIDNSFTNNHNNSSNNILIQNNTSNYYNIINNNNNITLNDPDESNIIQNTENGLNKRRYTINIKYKANEIIKEESELEKASVLSSKKNNDSGTKHANSSLNNRTEDAKS